MFALILALFGFTAQAQWREPEIKQVQAFNAEFDCWVCSKGFVNNPYVISLTDTLNLELQSYMRGTAVYPGMRTEALNLRSRHFVSAQGKTLPFQATYWFNPKRKTAPLAIYLPGIFQGIENSSTYEAVRLLIEAGNHVLAIANPLSATYMLQSPVADPAHFEREAEAILDIAQTFYDKHHTLISSVELSGASYGSFLAAIVLAKDAANTKPLINGQTTLIFPPLNMKKSIANLDALIDAYYASHVGLAPWDLIGTAFQDAVIGVAERIQNQFWLDQRVGFKSRFYPASVQSRLRELDLNDESQRKQIMFSKIVAMYINEDVDFYFRRDASIGYWIERAEQAGNRRIRILSTADDWLNVGSQFEVELPGWMLNDQHLLVRETGGHAGMVASPWFADFVVTSMRK